VDELTKIKIFSTVSIPIEVILNTPYSTTTVNIISWNKAFALFPDVTFLEPRTGYFLKFHNKHDTPYTRKYHTRGWPQVDPYPKWRSKPPLSLKVKEPRYVGDSKTWTILLDTTGVEPSMVPDFVLETSCFELTYFQEGPRSYSSTHWYYVLNAHTCESCVLKYKYTSSWSDERDLWWNFIKNKLDDLTRDELNKLMEEEKPAFWTQPVPPDKHLYLYNSKIEKPSTWTYYDDLVPEWRYEWLEHGRRIREAEKLAQIQEIDEL
jgi:hypothetical protein